MKDKKRLIEELDEHAPSLRPLLESETGFRVPPGYFDQLESEVFRQLDAIGAKPQPVRQAARTHWWQVLQGLYRPRLALALAGVMALALTAWWFFRPQAPTESAATLAANAVSPEDAEAYLLDNLLELEPEQIALVLPGEELPVITIPAPAATPADTKDAPSRELQISPEDLDKLLKDMSDDELEELL